MNNPFSLPLPNPVNQFNNVIQNTIEKLKLTKNDITLNFALSRSTFDGYKIIYTIQIHPMKMVIAGQQIRASQIDMPSLKEAIINNIDTFDIKYLTLKKFDTITCEFYFDFDKWFREATNGIKPRIFLSKFDQEFRLKIQPPKVIMFDIGRNDFFQYITNKFKKFIINSNKEKLWLGHILPQDFQKSINIKLANCFDYSYDYQMNRFIVQLKSVYVIGVSYAIGMAIKEIKNRKANILKFSDRVEKNSVNFKKDKWKEFLKKKFI